jgi:hypothetical protein
MVQQYLRDRYLERSRIALLGTSCVEQLLERRGLI